MVEGLRGVMSKVAEVLGEVAEGVTGAVTEIVQEAAREVGHRLIEEAVELAGGGVREQPRRGGSEGGE